MESAFSKYCLNTDRFPVSYLFLELYTRTAEKFDGKQDAANIVGAVLVRLGERNPSDELIKQAYEGLMEFNKYSASKTKSAPPPSKSKDRTFGEAMMEWLEKRSREQVIYMLADYDFERAKRLYRDTPAIVVEEMIQAKMEYEWTIAEKDFEAVLFGMGGKMKRSKGGGGEDGSFNANTAENQKSMEAALKRLRF